MKYEAVFLSFLLVACGGVDKQDTPVEQQALNRWADDAQWQVLVAQDERNTEALSYMLNDSSWQVRRSAALAFASVQDTAARASLGRALNDTMAAVRAASAFALGLCGDTITAATMMRSLAQEEDPVARQALFEAIGRTASEAQMATLAESKSTHRYDELGLAWALYRAVMHRNAGKECTQAAFALARSNDLEVRFAASEALGRMPAELLNEHAAELLEMISNEAEEELRLALIRAWGRSAPAPQELTFSTQWANSLGPLERVNWLRCLNGKEDPWITPFLIKSLSDTSPQVRSQAAEMLASTMTSATVPPVLAAAQARSDHRTAFALMRACLDHSEDKSRIRSMMQERFATNADPYIQAGLVASIAANTRGNPIVDALLPIITDPASTPIQRSSALNATFALLDREAGLTTLEVETLRALLQVNDAGVLADAATRISSIEKLKASDPNGLTSLAMTAMQGLDLPRDLEAKLMLERAVAHLDGKSAPPHNRPTYNHPIDRDRLRALPNGQAYRITTAKGTIDIITFAEEAPGSCVAFDSLVEAHYYDGKYFHRLVPNFVAQGGCPRGDGYGSMDWTLRTEIGLSRYTSGSVGLASAGPDTESCQFFITHSPTPHLDGNYTRFGQVTTGMDVLQQLEVGDVIARIDRLP